MLNHIATLWHVFMKLWRAQGHDPVPGGEAAARAALARRIVLTRDPDGGERCVACYLCAVACPVDCIALQATEDDDGRRYPEFFRINFSRCIFCGYLRGGLPDLRHPAHARLRDGRVRPAEPRLRKGAPAHRRARASTPTTTSKLAGVAIAGKDKGEGVNEEPPVESVGVAAMTAPVLHRGAVAVVATCMVITRANAVHALLYLVVSLLAVRAGVLAAGRAVRRRARGDRLRRRHHGAVRVRGDDARRRAGWRGEREGRRLTPAGWLGPGLLALVLLAEIAWIALLPTPGPPGRWVGPEEVGVACTGRTCSASRRPRSCCSPGSVGAWHLGSVVCLARSSALRQPPWPDPSLSVDMDALLRHALFAQQRPQL